MPKKVSLPEDRFFSSDPAQKKVAVELYQTVANLPLVCPHGHVDPTLFSSAEYTFGTPTEMLIIPDHYVFRMLYSQGIKLEDLGVPRTDGGPVEQDHRKIWRTFAENFYLFRSGTPTGVWLSDELVEVFGVQEKLGPDTADAIYDQIATCLESPDFQPRKLFERFNIEVLATTDAATDTLEHHKAIKASGWSGKIVPTFRPDAVVNIDMAGWKENIATLSEVSGVNVTDFPSFVQALEQRRAFFKEMGATATDHAALTPFTVDLSPAEADAIFQRGLKGTATTEDARLFTGHMLMEMARMSTEDGLVMQLHTSSYRNHNKAVYDGFGLDKGCDIPIQVDYTRNLQPLLNKYANDSNFRLLLFTLDETSYARELAPLAGHYPSVRLGPPWWFHDSWNGISRYFDQIIETAGVYNTCGFNDDTRAFPSIPARHDLWRRAAANWIAGLLVRGFIDEEDAKTLIYETGYNLAKKAYNL